MSAERLRQRGRNDAGNGEYMHRYAQVIIDIAHDRLDRPFTYRIPEALESALRLGSLVVVPFGKGNTLRKGYIIDFTDVVDYPDGRIKEIQAIAMAGSEETGAKAVELALWIKERYGSTLAAALKTVLTSRSQAKPVEQKLVRLLATPEDAERLRHQCAMKHQVARERLLRELLQVPCQPYRLIRQKLHITAAVINALQKKGIVGVETVSSLRNPVEMERSEPVRLQLSKEQQAVSDGVYRDFCLRRRGEVPKGEVPKEEATRGEVPCVSLVHGITGSGKTEVYISIIERIVADGYQAIMLIPEISLTYQTLLRFYRHFGDRVSVMNSTLSEGEKSDQFERARRGEIDVIIGPRSALFTPFPRIGVIILDEEHEGSYKNEAMPKYHARDVAEHIAQMHGGVVVLGSATPSLDAYYRAQTGQYRLYRLTKRLTGGSLPTVEIADMRKELLDGNRSILSGRLAELLSDRLAKKEQTMLFLNRRGFSGFVSCRSCGYVPVCPHCSVSLSLHGNRRLLCHYCGYEEELPERCPVCGSPYISGFHAGTEQVEQLLHREYPEARILRMDADTTKSKDGYEKILSAFANEEADILIGTQMIVKGHDFPKVTLVGILLADLSLHMGDYRAAERTFQLLTQAAGRAGRGIRPGNVVMQTYDPENYSIRYAAEQDYEGFYREELSYRRMLRYPPAEHLLAIQIVSASEEHAALFARSTRTLLEKLWEKERRRHPEKGKGEEAGTTAENELLIIGPAAASVEKLRDEFRQVLYVKSPDYDKLTFCKDNIEAAVHRAGESKDMDTVFQFDFDPMNVF